MLLLRWVPIDRRNVPPRRCTERFPLERATLLAMLDDETLYDPFAAAEVGYARSSRAHALARRALSTFAKEHGIADSYDNRDKRPKDTFAWYGKSWKRALGARMFRVADLMDDLRNRMIAHPGMAFYLDGETLRSAEELGLPSPVVAAGQEQSEPDRTSRSGHWLILILALLLAAMVLSLILGF